MERQLNPKPCGADMETLCEGRKFSAFWVIVNAATAKARMPGVVLALAMRPKAFREVVRRMAIESYGEFWPYYLREHSNQTCRTLHYIGSIIGLSCLGALVATGHWGFLAGGLFSGYGFAWVGHFVFEKNRPATFRYPLWSFCSDWRMVALGLSGRLGPELEKAGVAGSPA